MSHFRWETFTKLVDPVILSNCTCGYFSHVFASLGTYLLLLMGQTVYPQCGLLPQYLILCSD